MLIYEWGSSLGNELEAAFSAQLKYRNTEQLEPALALYQSQDMQGIGSVLTGLYRLHDGKNCSGSLALFLGLTQKRLPPIGSSTLNMNFN